jgi:hypothetical protein
MGVSGQNSIVKPKICKTKNPISKSRPATRQPAAPLVKTHWVRINSATWKLTDGEQVLVPKLIGHWAGHKVDRAIAWVIDAGLTGSLWFARVRDDRGDWTFGPVPLARAKEAAEARAHGRPFIPHDSYVTLEPVDLDWIAAAQLDRSRRGDNAL